MMPWPGTTRADRARAPLKKAFGPSLVAICLKQSAVDLRAVLRSFDVASSRRLSRGPASPGAARARVVLGLGGLHARLDDVKGGGAEDGEEARSEAPGEGQVLGPETSVAIAVRLVKKERQGGRGAASQLGLGVAADEEAPLGHVEEARALVAALLHAR